MSLRWTSEGRKREAESGKDPSCERGSALVMVLLAMSVLMLLGLAFTSMASTELRIASGYRNGLAALDLAEAGLERSIVRLKSDPNWREGFANVSLGGGTYTVTLSETEQGKLLVTSTGVMGNWRRVLTANLSYGGGKVYNNAILVGSTIALEKDSKIDGDIFINGDFIARGDQKHNVEINGSVTTAPAGTKMVADYPPVITGGYRQTAEAVALPAESADWYRARATAVMTGPVNFPKSNVFSNDLVFVEGDAKINGEVSGRGTIVATGTIEINGQLEHEGDQGALALIGLGGISVKGDTEAVLYSPGTVTIQNKKSVKGGVFAGAISAGQGVEIEYDRGLFEAALPPGLPGTGWTLRSWSERNP